MSASVQLSGLACRRGGRLLFSGLDLTVSPGGAVLVTGPNGCGKSSLLRVCAGLLPAEAGLVTISGGMALSDERLALDTGQTLGAALGYWARLDGVAAASVDEALDAMGLGHLAAVPVRMLSTGQRKRASLARVMASGAGVWLLDEPGNGLDADSMARLQSACAAHRAAGGIVIAASHQSLGLDDVQILALEGLA